MARHARSDGMDEPGSWEDGGGNRTVIEAAFYGIQGRGYYAVNSSFGAIILELPGRPDGRLYPRCGNWWCVESAEQGQNMSVGLLALLDDVAGLVKVAAASLDDVAGQAAKAGVKAAGAVD